MLNLYVKGTEYYDDKTNSFFTVKDEVLNMEHSLLSLSLWEAKYKKSFLDELEKGLSIEETIYYIKCMCLNDINDENIFLCINSHHLKIILDYLNDPMTATTFYDLKTNTSNKKEKITSELIYYWMLESGIPFECDKWNLNHLLTLIRVVSYKNSNQKMSKKETREFNRALMAKRRAGLK